MTEWMGPAFNMSDDGAAGRLLERCDRYGGAFFNPTQRTRHGGSGQANGMALETPSLPHAESRHREGSRVVALFDRSPFQQPRVIEVNAGFRRDDTSELKRTFLELKRTPSHRKRKTNYWFLRRLRCSPPLSSGLGRSNTSLFSSPRDSFFFFVGAILAIFLFVSLSSVGS